MSAETFIDVLRDRADARPDSQAFTFLSGEDGNPATLTYRELDREARRIGAALEEYAAEGVRVLLLYPPGLPFISALFGVWYAGCISVPVYPPSPSQGRAAAQGLVRVLEQTQAEAVLTTRDLRYVRELLPAEALSAVTWLETDDVGPYDDGHWFAPKVRDDAVAMIQYTSGSTSDPKGVVLKHRHVLANQAAIAEALDMRSTSVVVSWLPMYHDMGLIGFVLQPLYFGIPCYLMSPLDFLARPVRWLRAISRYGGTVSGAPNFGYELCARKVTDEEKASLDLSAWRIALTAAEPIRPETLRRFTDAFARCRFNARAFYPCYGLAEATLLVTGSTPDSGARTMRLARQALQDGLAIPTQAETGSVELVSCGGPPSGHRVLIVDPASCKPLDGRQVGEVWVQSPSVASGYWRRTQESASLFDAHPHDESKGSFLRTGDLGFVADGELYVTGRIKDVISVRGRNIYPQDIELVAQQADKRLRPGSGAAFGVELGGEERICLIQETTVDDREEGRRLARAVWTALTEALEVAPAAVLLVPPRMVPKTTSGKLARHACRQAFLENRLSVVAEWRAAGQAHETQADVET